MAGQRARRRRSAVANPAPLGHRPTAPFRAAAQVPDLGGCSSRRIRAAPQPPAYCIKPGPLHQTPHRPKPRASAVTI